MSLEPDSDPLPEPSPARRSRRAIVTGIVGLIVLVVVFAVVLPRFADYGDVWDQLTSMSGWYLLALFVVEVVNLSTYAPNYMVALPGMRWRQALELQFAGIAVSNVAPLGGAVSMGFQYRMMRAWGFNGSASSRAMVITGVWNNLVNLALPVVSLSFLTLGGGRNAALIVAAEVGTIAFVVVLGGFLLIITSDAGARVVGQGVEAMANTARRLFRRRVRRSLADTMVRFRKDSAHLVRHRWLALTLATMAGTLTIFLVLLVAVRAVGIDGTEVSTTEAFAAWSITRLLGAVPITPGGLGIIDVGLASALSSFGGDEAQVVAVVLLYRVLTFVPPILLGAIAMFTWRRHPERLVPRAEL